MTRVLLSIMVLSTGFALAEPTWDGRVSIRTLYSADDGQGTPSVLINFLDLDLDGADLTLSGLALELDSTFIWDDTNAKERRFGRTESIQRIRTARLSHPLLNRKLTVYFGRSLIPESGNAWVDGLNLDYAVNETLALGAYGGFRPIPITYAPSTDYQTGGTYVRYRRGSRLEVDGGYNVILRDGIDRQFVFQRAHFRPNRKWSFFNYANFESAKDPDFSTFLAGVHVRPFRALTLSLNLSRYSVEQYRNAVIYQNVIEPNQALLLGDEVIDLVYNRARLSLGYRFAARFYVYQMFELKQRSQDNRQGALYTTGLRDDDFFGLSLDLRGTVERGYQSDTWILAYQLNGDIGRHLSWESHGTVVDSQTIDRFTERGRTFDEAQRIYLLGGVLHARLARVHRIALLYDVILETELQDARNQDAIFVHTVMFRYQMRF